MPSETMADFRTANPRPTLFELIHRWYLTPEQVEQLSYWKKQHLSARILNAWLQRDSGRLRREQCDIVFIPIYLNTSRLAISEAADKNEVTYYLSFRSIETDCGSHSIVLIKQAPAA